VSLIQEDDREAWLRKEKEGKKVSRIKN